MSTPNPDQFKTCSKVCAAYSKTYKMHSYARKYNKRGRTTNHMKDHSRAFPKTGKPSLCGGKTFLLPVRWRQEKGNTSPRKCSGTDRQTSAARSCAAI
mmetsp:Transcript_25120/g.63159  ORF Transcript_25120/g.63159 Transcript_25120/m.63159 type:complete len:98 (+) Transcript_25120:5257-5550(+)